MCVDRCFFHRGRLTRPYRAALDRTAYDAQREPPSVPDDRAEFASLMLLLFSEPMREAAALLLASVGDRPSMHNVRAACRRCGAHVLLVAPAFGYLPTSGTLREWTDTADPEDRPGVLIAGAPEHAAAYALWRASGGEPRVTLTYDDRLAREEPVVVEP